MRLLLLALLASAAAAADLHVAAGAAPGGDGTADHPFSAIQAATDAARPGDRVAIAAGIYREAIVVGHGGDASAPLLLSGEPGAEVRGSEAVTGFERADGSRPVWVHRGWATDSQQVFADADELARIGEPPPPYRGKADDGSVMLTARLAAPQDLPAGTFTIADGDLWLRLADDGDPNARAIEASTRAHLLTCADGAAHVRLAGLRFCRSNTSAAKRGGAAVELGDDCEARDCVFTRCDFAGVAVAWKRAGARIVDCVITDNGCVGIAADGHAGFSVRRCVIAGNNTRGFNPEWHAGGIKVTARAWGDVVDCVVRDNRGIGIWYDWADSGQVSRVTGDRVTGNVAAGIAIEASADVVVADDLVGGNERRGIYVSASERVTVCHDTIVGTRGMAALELGGTPRAGRRLADVRVFNCVIAGNERATYDVRIVRENGDDVRGLSFHHDLVWRAGGTLALWWGLDGRGRWLGGTFPAVAPWRAASGLGADCIEADPRFAGDGGGLDAASPARGAGWTGDPLARADLGAAVPAPAP